MSIFIYIIISRMVTITLIFCCLLATWLLIRMIAHNVVSIRNYSQNCRLDVNGRQLKEDIDRAKLDAAKQRARMMLLEQRKMLQSGAPLAQMWKSGVFDVEIDQ